MHLKSVGFRLCFLLLTQSACATTGIWQSLHQTGPALIQLATEAGDGQLNVPGNRRGQACSHNILGIVSFGDNSLASAKENGGIERISTIDHGIVRVLTFYGRLCTIVTGSGAPDPGVNVHSNEPALPTRPVPPLVDEQGLPLTSTSASRSALSRDANKAFGGSTPDTVSPSKTEAPSKLSASIAELECRGDRCLRPHEATDQTDETLSQACGEGASMACSILAYRLVSGRDPAAMARGLDLYARGCKLGDLGTCTDWGICLMEGLGTHASPERAAKAFETSCQAGNGRACLFLGYLHEQGRGVVKNLAEATRLYKLACNAGETPACAGDS